MQRVYDMGEVAVPALRGIDLHVGPGEFTANVIKDLDKPINHYINIDTKGKYAISKDVMPVIAL